MKNHPGNLLAAADQDGIIFALATTEEALSVLLYDIEYRQAPE